MTNSGGLITQQLAVIWAFLVARMVKHLPTMQETQVHIPGSGRSPGNGNPLQYSCLENSMDGKAWSQRGACWATVLGVTKHWK